MTRIRRSTRRQRGQSLVEAIVVIPVFGAVILGIFQAVLFYRAKAVVDYAALQAARSGATHFAQMSAMDTGLVRGLMPLYTHKSTRAGAIKGYAKALVDVHTGGAKIEIISPTKAVFDQWKEPQYDGVEGIPNDSLPFRGSKTKAGVTVQDANVLKIRVTYKYPLIVPFIDRLIGTKDLARSAATCLQGGCHSVYSMPIVAQAIVHMQTPIRDKDILPNADSGGGSGGGSGSGPSGGGGGSGGGNVGGGAAGGGGAGGSGGGSGGHVPPHVCV
jgi:type II secretory pathway pseudopilin PulG